VMVDLTASPPLDELMLHPLANPEKWLQLGGPVVLLTADGSLIARSLVEVNISAELLAASPDGLSFAFIGRPKDAFVQKGVYVSAFVDRQARRLMDFADSTDPNAQDRWSLDWSPDGRNLLLSENGRILLVDVSNGDSKEIARGGSARWSPTGDWISYSNLQHQATLQNTVTGEARVIDRHYVVRPIDWSPDGRYLSLPEINGCLSIYGCVWIYRVSDGAFLPIREYKGARSRTPQWIDLRRTN